MDALAPFHAPAWPRDAGDPQPLPYLNDPNDATHGHLDIQVNMSIRSAQMRQQKLPAQSLSLASYRTSYWTPAQLITHHTSGGCNLQTGDLIGTGTISGPQRGEEGALLEITQGGKQPVTLLPGGSYFHHTDSFAMMRGGHLDVCVLGAFQVSATGDLANWHTGAPDAIPAVGGAMDLVAGVKRVVVLMEHAAKNGEHKLLQSCTLPLTGVGVVDRIVTDLAVMDVTPQGLKLVELAPGVTLDEVQSKTGVPLL